MHVTFKNESKSSKSIITVENCRYVINPLSSVEVFCNGSAFEFFAESSAMQELADAANEIENNSNNDKLKDRILTRLAKKAAEKAADAALNSVIRYNVFSVDGADITITLTEGAFPLFTGRFADLLDILPVPYVFLRAESENAVLTVSDVKILNRKKYLKLVRGVLLFMHAGLTAINLLFFLPEYFLIKLFTSSIFVRMLISGLYRKSPQDRQRILNKREEMCEERSDNSGCFSTILKIAVLVSLFLGFCIYSMFTDPDVIISEDFSSVVYFDETFVKIDSALPSDAKKVFLEDSIAYYPLSDGEYDAVNYFCEIYESDDGTRYMWLQDNCSDPQSADMEYSDYDNPLVYISTEIN